MMMITVRKFLLGPFSSLTLREGGLFIEGEPDEEPEALLESAPLLIWVEALGDCGPLLLLGPDAAEDGNMEFGNIAVEFASFERDLWNLVTGDDTGEAELELQ